MSKNATSVERAAALLAQMTLTEKTQQLVGIMPTAFLGTDGPDQSGMERVLGQGIGRISNIATATSTAADVARISFGVQRFLREHTRLGIPAIVHAEALNGFVAPEFTSFPTAIGLAATWNPEAVQEMAEIISRQMRAVGVRNALSPVMDIARDARWGRVHETYGEDVYLTSAFGVAFTRGLQGEDLRTGVAATGKHFLGYALSEGGQNMATTHLGPRELYDVYATPFEAAIQLAGLNSVMNSYSEIDGVPVGASREILTGMLRDRMGFDGVVVSDYSTVEWLKTRQLVASTLGEAGALALQAGLDVELPSPAGYGAALEEEVRAGRVDEATVDDAVMRVLVQKFELGLFDESFADADPIAISEVAGEGAELSSRLAAESITLLKNNGILPLHAPARIAVIGPNAESAIAHFAAYTYPSMLDMLKGLATGESRMAGMETMTSSAEGGGSAGSSAMAQRMMTIAATDTDALVRESYGASDLATAVRAAFPGAVVESATGVGIHPDDPQDIAAAVELAQQAEVAILALGGRGGWFGTRITEGEGTDAAHVEIPPHQVALVKALKATGTALVGIFFQGRAYAIGEIDELLDASLVAYYPGPQGGHAVASVLAGTVSPSGKLPYTVPRATGQVPIYYSQKHGSGYRRGAGDMFREYIDLENSPLYAFGHGLSYTRFRYGAIAVESDRVDTDGGVITAEVDVQNIGDRDGVETVQFYAAVTTSGITRHASQLVGFARLALSPGQRATVRCAIPVSLLGYTGTDGRFVLQPGSVALSAGGASDALGEAATVLLGGGTADLEGRRAYLSTVAVELGDVEEIIEVAVEEAATGFDLETVTLGYLLDDVASRSVLDAHLPTLANHPMIGLARQMPFLGVLEMAGGSLDDERRAQLLEELGQLA